jgi:hypothetical protein
MRRIGSPETSVFNQPTLQNIPEDGRIQVNRSKSVHICVVEYPIIPHLFLNNCSTQHLLRRILGFKTLLHLKIEQKFERQD